MSEANVHLTIRVRNKTVEGIMPFLKWALENNLESIVSFEPREDNKSFSQAVQTAKAIYTQQNDNKSFLDQMHDKQMYMIENLHLGRESDSGS